jgi:RNase P subunit RPR2
MKRPTVNYVIVMEELRKEGKIQISPISKEANSFDCPKCGNLLSPENPNSYSELDHEDDKGALIQCRLCKTNMKLLWQSDPFRSICKQFNNSKWILLFILYLLTESSRERENIWELKNKCNYSPRAPVKSKYWKTNREKLEKADPADYETRWPSSPEDTMSAMKIG